jgi:hypothetical protein
MAVEWRVMLREFLASFLGALGGFAIAVAALKFLIGQLIEHQLATALADHQHGLNTQLAKLQVQMSRLTDVLSRRNEREFAVTEGAWELLIKTVGTAQGELGDGKSVPAFMMMNEREALALIEKLPFRNDDKLALVQVPPSKRDELFRKISFRRGVVLSLQEWTELKNWVSTHQIFLDAKVLAKVISLRDELYALLVHARTYAEEDEAMPLSERVVMHRMLGKDFNEALDALALIIRTRFGFADDEPDA